MRLIPVTAVVSVAIGLASGGSLRDFPGSSLRWWWIGLAGIAVRFVELRSMLADTGSAPR
jgi:hypothetical protein